MTACLQTECPVIGSSSRFLNSKVLWIHDGSVFTTEDYVSTRGYILYSSGDLVGPILHESGHFFAFLVRWTLIYTA